MTPYDPQRHHRRSIRLKGYDYAQAGAYFVTICQADRECLFGRVVDGAMRLNQYGAIVQRCWDDLPRHYPHVELDAFVVMPNHVHAIIVLTDAAAVGAGFAHGAVGAGFARGTVTVGAGFSAKEEYSDLTNPSRQPTISDLGIQKPAPTPPTAPATPSRHGLPEIVRGFKTWSARRVNALRHATGDALWQRNYYEHIIRNDRELNAIRQYIASNPSQWATDRDHPAVGAVGKDIHRNVPTRTEDYLREAGI